MAKITQEEQLAAIERLQAEHGDNATPAERGKFMRAIASVPAEELKEAPEPAKQKRGPKPSPKHAPASVPSSPA